MIKPATIAGLLVIAWTATCIAEEGTFFSRDLEELYNSALDFKQAAPATDKNLPKSESIRTEGITEIRADITLPSNRVPRDLAAAEFSKLGTQQHVMGTSRYDFLISYRWKSPAFCHRTLYFEQATLERYGVTNKCLQPAFSAVRFYGTVPLVPFLCLKDVAGYRASTVGYLRPGSPLP